MERKRKTNIKRGERTQTPLTFRIDNELLFQLVAQNINNKGRFINEAIKAKLHEMGVL